MIESTSNICSLSPHTPIHFTSHHSLQCFSMPDNGEFTEILGIQVGIQKERFYFLAILTDMRFFWGKEGLLIRTDAKAIVH